MKCLYYENEEDKEREGVMFWKSMNKIIVKYTVREWRFIIFDGLSTAVILLCYCGSLNQVVCFDQIMRLRCKCTKF